MKTSLSQQSRKEFSRQRELVVEISDDDIFDMSEQEVPAEPEIEVDEVRPRIR